MQKCVLYTPTVKLIEPKTCVPKMWQIYKNDTSLMHWPQSRNIENLTDGGRGLRGTGLEWIKFVFVLLDQGDIDLYGINLQLVVICIWRIHLLNLYSGQDLR